MKKQFGLPLMLASALAFSACSSDDVAENGASNGSYDFTKGGYMAVNINLPSKSGGAFKGVGDDHTNDNFNDGLPSEYAVKKATLVLFKKATGTGTTEAPEGEATFHSIYDLGNISMSMDGTQQITSTVKVVAQADDDAQDKELLGLVILNGSSTLVDVASNKINGKTLTAGTTTFSELATSITDGNANSYYSDADGILMMNAPLATQQGGGSKPTSAGAGIATLVDVTKNVYGTKEEALAKTAANFYVERALAKVTFNGSDGQILGNDVTLDGTPKTGVMTWKVDKWNLDVTNKKSYFVHNMGSIDNTLETEYTLGGGRALPKPYRFIGSESVGGTTPKYRTYWGIDPNYNTTYDATHFDIKDAKATINGELGAEKPQYCFENTFDVANQNQNQTTRAIVKVILNGGNTFYVFNGDKSKLYSEGGCKERIMGEIANLKEVHEWIVANLKAGETYDITANATVTLKEATSYKTDAKVEVETFTVTIPAAKSSTGSATDVTFTPVASVVTELNAALKNVTEYEDGIAYYPIRIKHFGNELTPWNNYNKTTNATGHKATAGDVYDLNNVAKKDNAPANFLGRYGVLRNNWYELEVSSITGIGEPRIPAVTTDPDDELKQFISVNINILSWAKRVQKEDL